jgi:hypothetical protein
MEKGMVDTRRAANTNFLSVTKLGAYESRWRITLCENTVPMARTAPEAVDMLAATISIKHQPPINGGAL